MKTIRVAICDDAQYLCRGFEMKFAEFDNIEFVGAAYSASKCIEMLTRTKPDVLLMDIRMETEKAGIEIIPEIKSRFPELKIMMLTSYDDSEYVFEAFANGADNYCDKTLPIKDIVDAICDMVNEQIILKPDIVKKIVETTKNVKSQQSSIIYVMNLLSKLSPGENELLRWIYEGKNYKDFAEKKCIELESVNKTRNRLLKKMEATSMKEVVKILKDLKLFELISKNSEE